MSQVLALAAGTLLGLPALLLAWFQQPRPAMLPRALVLALLAVVFLLPREVLPAAAALGLVATLAGGDDEQLARARRPLGLAGGAALAGTLGGLWMVAGPPPTVGAWLGPGLAVAALTMLAGLWPFTVYVAPWVEGAASATRSLWCLSLALLMLCAIRLWSQIPGGAVLGSTPGLLHLLLAAVAGLTLIRGGLLGLTASAGPAGSAAILVAAWGMLGIGLGGVAGNAAALLAALDLAATHATHASVEEWPPALRGWHQVAVRAWPPWPGFWSRLLVLLAAYQAGAIWMAVALAALLLGSLAGWPGSRVEVSGPRARRARPTSDSRGARAPAAALMVQAFRPRAVAAISLAAGLSAGLWLALVGPVSSR